MQTIFGIAGIGILQKTEQNLSKSLLVFQVKVGDDDFIHVRAHKSFKDEVSLWGIQEGKKLDCVLEHFE